MRLIGPFTGEWNDPVQRMGQLQTAFVEVRARTRRGGDPIRLIELTLDANPGAVRVVLREAFGLSDRGGVR
jgi:hypothetical protein